MMISHFVVKKIVFSHHATFYSHRIQSWNSRTVGRMNNKCNQRKQQVKDQDFGANMFRIENADCTIPCSSG